MMKFVRKIASAAAILAFGAFPSFAQTATNPIVTLSTVNIGAWTDLGAGPYQVQMYAGGALFVVSASCPPVSSVLAPGAGAGAGGISLAYSANGAANTITPFNTTLHVCTQIIGRGGAQILMMPMGSFGMAQNRFAHWHYYCNCYDNLP